MLKRLNRDYKQSAEEIEQEFVNCKYLVLMDNCTEEKGYLIAISTDSSSFDALFSITNEYPKGTVFLKGGIYEDGMATGIQHVVEGSILC